MPKAKKKKTLIQEHARLKVVRTKTGKIASVCVPKDHDCGYFWSSIEKMMTKKEFKEFKKWMYGQTCAIDEKTNQVVVYSWDIDRFLDMLRKGKPTYWD